MSDHATFKALPLIRSFMSVDVDDGMVYRVEVRRDPVTGMTLMQKTPTVNHYTYLKGE